MTILIENVLSQVYFSLMNAENTESLYLSAFLTLYNTIFCSAPIILYALFEQNYSATELLSRPELYKLQTSNRLMSYTHFIEWMLAGNNQSSTTVYKKNIPLKVLISFMNFFVEQYFSC